MSLLWKDGRHWFLQNPTLLGTSLFATFFVMAAGLMIMNAFGGA